MEGLNVASLRRLVTPVRAGERHLRPYVDLQAAGRRTQRQSMAWPRGPNYRESISLLISLIHHCGVGAPADHPSRSNTAE